jgi:TetR/AcrR family transcriptional regulator, transcriptional repressor for nem operon
MIRVARPLEFDRDAAVDAVMNKLWREGYEACSVKAVSEMLGISRSSYYNAFGSREALFGRVLERYLAQSEPEQILVGATPEMRVRTVLTTWLRAVCAARARDPKARGCLGINSVAELANTHKSLGPMVAEAIVTGGVARLETVLRWGVASGELDRSLDVLATALALQSLSAGINVMSKVIRGENDLWQATQTTLKALGLLDEEVLTTRRSRQRRNPRSRRAPRPALP